MAPGRGAFLQLLLACSLMALATASLTPTQQFQQQQLQKQQQALHCETIRLQNQQTALNNLPACGGFAEFNFANFTSDKADFGNYCASYCSVHQGLVKWQEQVFYSSQLGKKCNTSADDLHDLDVIAAYWCSTAADGSYCFKTLFAVAQKGAPTCASIKSLDQDCAYALRDTLNIFASVSLNTRFQQYFNQCKVAYPPARPPSPVALPGVKVPTSPTFTEPAVNFISGGHSCPNGSTPLGCTEQDCAATSCARYPGSQCVSDQCNKCVSKYNEQVGITNDLFGWSVNCSCPDGSLPKTCDPSPCAALSCPAFPEAYCLVDTCYGCNAIYMVNGSEVNCGTQTKFPGANVTAPAVVNAETLPATSSFKIPSIGKAAATSTSNTSYAPPAMPAVVNPYAAGQTCPNGQPPPVTPPAPACNASVCAQNLCARYPMAQCVPDECDSCKAKYNLNVGLPNDNVGYEVTASCPCPDGSRPFTRQNGDPCIPDPCQFLKCENFPNAYCVTDLCNGCNAVFLINGQEVDCGNQVRFPGNVTGSSTTTATSPANTSVSVAPSSASTNQSQVVARTVSLVTALQQGNLTAVLPLVKNNSVLYLPNLPGPLGYQNVSIVAPFLSAVKGNVSTPVLKSFFLLDAATALVTEAFSANALGNVYATLVWEFSNSTYNGTLPSSNWQLQYAALTPAPNGTIT